MTIIESPNFVGTWNESRTKLTIKPMAVSYEEFVADKILPWGKIHSFELDAMARPYSWPRKLRIVRVSKTSNPCYNRALIASTAQTKDRPP